MSFRLMSFHLRMVVVIAFVAMSSVSQAFAQIAQNPQQSQCDALKAQAAALGKGPGNLSEELAAVEREILLACRPHIPPPYQYPVCGTAQNAAGTGQVEYLQVYSSQYAKWCVDSNFWPSNSQYFEPYFAYYDQVVPLLTSLFHVTLPLPIVVEVQAPPPKGGVGAACDCGAIFGAQQSVQLTGDNFSATLTGGSDGYPTSGKSIPGFFGYLLPLHETVNAFTGSIAGGGWPADWWADHISVFANAVDYETFKQFGKYNPALAAAAQAQLSRLPNLKGGTEMVMFTKLFSDYGGFPALSKFFALVKQDQIQWKSVSHDYSRDNDVGQVLSEYVIAYLSLAFGTTSDLTATFSSAGVGNSVPIASTGGNTKAYALNAAHVKDIANAHCSIRSAGSPSSELAALQSGNYKLAIATGGKQSSCPSECSWTQNKCAAKW